MTTGEKEPWGLQQLGNDFEPVLMGKQDMQMREENQVGWMCWTQIMKGLESPDGKSGQQDTLMGLQKGRSRRKVSRKVCPKSVG